MRDQYQRDWAAHMIYLLLEIKTAVEAAPPEQQCLSPSHLADFETRYDATLEAGFQTCPILEPIETSTQEMRQAQTASRQELARPSPVSQSRNAGFYV